MSAGLRHPLPPQLALCHLADPVCESDLYRYPIGHPEVDTAFSELYEALDTSIPNFDPTQYETASNATSEDIGLLGCGDLQGANKNYAMFQALADGDPDVYSAIITWTMTCDAATMRRFVLPKASWHIHRLLEEVD